MRYEEESMLLDPKKLTNLIAAMLKQPVEQWPARAKPILFRYTTERHYATKSEKQIMDKIIYRFQLILEEKGKPRQPH